MIHTVNVGSGDAIDYKTYQRHDRCLSYDEERVARSAKQDKQIETAVKPHQFVNSDAVIVLSFLRQSNHTSGSNGVPDSVAL